MNLTRFSIDNDRITWILIILLVGAGIAAFGQLPKQQDPGFTIRTAVVTTRFPGASPERVEQLVTDRIEKALQEMPELDNLVSQSRNGISIINANFKESY
ncbi:MAG: efflux RND transporter permease subunit, partial [Pseudomonadota bacterium]